MDWNKASILRYHIIYIRIRIEQLKVNPEKPK